MTNAAPAVTALAASRSVLYGVLVLALLSVVGAVISVVGDLSPTFLDAMGSEGRLSIPLPMTVAQVLLALAAGSRRRPLAMLGSGLVALALFAGVVSGFFDGGYADERLTGLQRGYQVLFVAGLAVVGVVAVRRFIEAARARG